jgi:hypothetical protein
VHQTRIAGDDHDEAVAVVLHPLQQDLDRLGAEVHAPLALRRERVRLVDEQDAVERALDHAVRLERGRADVLPDEPGAVDLDEMALLEEADGAVHLGEQARDRRLAGAGVAEEDEVLRGRDLREAVLRAPRLHLEEGDERMHLLLDGLEADERVELRLHLPERARGLRTRAEEVADKFVDVRPAGAPQLLAEAADRPQQVVEPSPRHLRRWYPARRKGR